MGATICFFDDMIKDLESVEPSKVCDYISEIWYLCVLNPFVLEREDWGAVQESQGWDDEWRSKSETRNEGVFEVGCV